MIYTGRRDRVKPSKKIMAMIFIGLTQAKFNIKVSVIYFPL